MKPITLIGIVLVVLGALALAYQGINYTRQEKVLDIGPIHATAEKHERDSPPSGNWRTGVAWRSRLAGRGREAKSPEAGI